MGLDNPTHSDIYIVRNEKGYKRKPIKDTVLSNNDTTISVCNKRGFPMIVYVKTLKHPTHHAHIKSRRWSLRKKIANTIIPCYHDTHLYLA